MFIISIFCFLFLWFLYTSCVIRKGFADSRGSRGRCESASVHDFPPVFFTSVVPDVTCSIDVAYKPQRTANIVLCWGYGYYTSALSTAADVCVPLPCSDITLTAKTLVCKSVPECSYTLRQRNIVSDILRVSLKPHLADKSKQNSWL